MNQATTILTRAAIEKEIEEAITQYGATLEEVLVS